MKASELVNYILENELEDLEIMIQPPCDVLFDSVPLEDRDLEYNDTYVFIG